jgi:hypothetical protein
MTYRKKIAKREKNNEAEFQDNLMLKDEKKLKKKKRKPILVSMADS